VGDRRAPADERGEPGAPGAIRIGGGRSRRAGHRAVRIKADQVREIRDRGQDLGQTPGAGAAGHPGRQGMEQHLIPGQARLDHVRAPRRRVQQGRALRHRLAPEHQRRLQRAQQQHRREGQGQDDGETGSDRQPRPEPRRRVRRHDELLNRSA
jgi:hypothetical protein